MRALRVAVLGGGISGLSAAYALRERSRERGISIDVVLLEGARHTGGCIETRRDGGYVLEMGPDSIVVEKPAALNLTRRLGLGDHIEPIRPEFRGARVLRNGKLVPLPDGFRLFTPLSIGALVTSGLLSPRGIARAALEPLIPAKRGDEDESLGSFVSRRFGREILDRLAQPLLGGIYSGNPDRLSVTATMPQLREVERTHGSLMRGMRAMSSRNGNAARLVSLRNGLGELPEALTNALGDVVRPESSVVGLKRCVDARGSTQWRIALDRRPEIEADAVICALPGHAAAPLVASIDGQLAGMLAAIVYHSVTTITMAYATADIPPLPRCTGYVVPAIEGRPFLATTFSTQKFAHRSPDGVTLLRAFAGGPNASAVSAVDDDALCASVRAEFFRLLGISAPPQFSIVRRWPSAMPEYTVGHLDRVERMEHRAMRLGNFVLAGAAYRGVGIADCVRSGEAAADVVLSGASFATPRDP